MAYPSSIDTDTPSAGTTLLSADDHSNRHNVIGSAVVALENKVGLGAGSAAAGNILVGSGSGTSVWSQTWNSGSLGTPTIGTPAITGGTINNTVLGTPSITLGSDATGDLYYRNSGGSLSRLAAGTNGQFLKQGASIPSWGNVMPNFSMAVGTSSNPTYTGTADATIPEMTQTITTKGGNVLALFYMTISNNDNTKTTWFSFKVDSNAKVGEFHWADPVSGYTQVISNGYLFTGLNAGSHTFIVQWYVNGGTVTAVDTARQFILIEGTS